MDNVGNTGNKDFALRFHLEDKLAGQNKDWQLAVSGDSGKFVDTDTTDPDILITQEVLFANTELGSNPNAQLYSNNEAKFAQVVTNMLAVVLDETEGTKYADLAEGSENKKIIDLIIAEAVSITEDPEGTPNIGDMINAVSSVIERYDLDIGETGDAGDVDHNSLKTIGEGEGSQLEAQLNTKGVAETFAYVQELSGVTDAPIPLADAQLFFGLLLEDIDSTVLNKEQLDKMIQLISSGDGAKDISQAEFKEILFFMEAKTNVDFSSSVTGTPSTVGASSYTNSNSGLYGATETTTELKFDVEGNPTAYIVSSSISRVVITDSGKDGNNTVLNAGILGTSIDEYNSQPIDTLWGADSLEELHGVLAGTEGDLPKAETIFFIESSIRTALGLAAKDALPAGLDVDKLVDAINAVDTTSPDNITEAELGQIMALAEKIANDKAVTDVDIFATIDGENTAYTVTGGTEDTPYTIGNLSLSISEATLDDEITAYNYTLTEIETETTHAVTDNPDDADNTITTTTIDELNILALLTHTTVVDLHAALATGEAEDEVGSGATLSPDKTVEFITGALGELTSPSAEQIEQIVNIVDGVDLDSAGNITPEELGQILALMNEIITDESNTSPFLTSREGALLPAVTVTTEEGSGDGNKIYTISGEDEDTNLSIRLDDDRNYQNQAVTLGHDGNLGETGSTFDTNASIEENLGNMSLVEIFNQLDYAGITSFDTNKIADKQDVTSFITQTLDQYDASLPGGVTVQQLVNSMGDIKMHFSFDAFKATLALVEELTGQNQLFDGINSNNSRVTKDSDSESDSYKIEMNGFKYGTFTVPTEGDPSFKSANEASHTLGKDGKITLIDGKTAPTGTIQEALGGMSFEGIFNSLDSNNNDLILASEIKTFINTALSAYASPITLANPSVAQLVDAIIPQTDDTATYEQFVTIMAFVEASTTQKLFNEIPDTPAAENETPVFTLDQSLEIGGNDYGTLSNTASTYSYAAPTDSVSDIVIDHYKTTLGIDGSITGDFDTNKTVEENLNMSIQEAFATMDKVDESGTNNTANDNDYTPKSEVVTFVNDILSQYGITEPSPEEIEKLVEAIAKDDGVNGVNEDEFLAILAFVEANTDKDLFSEFSDSNQVVSGTLTTGQSVSFNDVEFGTLTIPNDGSDYTYESYGDDISDAFEAQPAVTLDKNGYSLEPLNGQAFDTNKTVEENLGIETADKGEALFTELGGTKPAFLASGERVEYANFKAFLTNTLEQYNITLSDIGGSGFSLEEILDAVSNKADGNEDFTFAQFQDVLALIEAAAGENIFSAVAVAADDDDDDKLVAEGFGTIDDTANNNVFTDQSVEKYSFMESNVLYETTATHTAINDTPQHIHDELSSNNNPVTADAVINKLSTLVFGGFPLEDSQEAIIRAIANSGTDKNVSVKELEAIMAYLENGGNLFNAVDLDITLNGTIEGFGTLTLEGDLETGTLTYAPVGGGDVGEATIGESPIESLAANAYDTTEGSDQTRFDALLTIQGVDNTSKGSGTDTLSAATVATFITSALGVAEWTSDLKSMVTAIAGDAVTFSEFQTILAFSDKFTDEIENKEAFDLFEADDSDITKTEDAYIYTSPTHGTLTYDYNTDPVTVTYAAPVGDDAGADDAGAEPTAPTSIFTLEKNGKIEDESEYDGAENFEPFQFLDGIDNNQQLFDALDIGSGDGNGDDKIRKNRMERFLKDLAEIYGIDSIKDIDVSGDIDVDDFNKIMESVYGAINEKRATQELDDLVYTAVT
jgi:hypothetical protein